MATQEEIQAKAQNLSPEKQQAIKTQVAGMKAGELDARVQNSVENPTQAPVVAPVEETPVAPVETPTQAPVVEPELFSEPVKAEVKAPQKPIMSDKEEFELRESKKQVTQQERQSKLDGFRSLLEENADRAEMAKYVNENPDLRTQFGIQAKNFYKTKQNADFQMKYASASPKSLYDAYINSDIVVGSSEYNMLPPETKSAFEQYKAQKDITMTTEDLETSLANDKNKVLEFTETKTPVFAGTDIRATYDKLINAPEISSKRTEVEGLATELGTLNNDINAIEDDIIAEYEGSGRSQSFINAKIAKEQRALQKKYNNVSVQYQNSLASFQDMKSDIEREMKYVEFEEERAFQNYQIELGQYNADRSRMDAFTMAEFERKNAELATQRQQEFTMQMKQIDQDFALKNQKPQYMTDKNGNLLAIIDGKASKVMDSTGEVVAITKTKDYTDSTNWNADMGMYVTTRTYEDGNRTPDFFTSDIAGDSSISMAVFDGISKIESYPPRTPRSKSGNGLECGEAVNNYLKANGISDIWMGDSFESKKKWATQNYPQVGGLAVWNAEYTDAGHVGIVTGINQAEGKVQITDYNRDNDGKKNTYEIPISQVVNSDGGFVHLDTISEKQDTELALSDIAMFNSNTFKPESIKDEITRSKYENFLEVKTDIMSQKEADMQDILAYSRGGKELTDTSLKSIEKFDSALNQLASIQEEISTQDTGPIIGTLRSMNPYDTDAQTLKASLTSLIPNLARGVYGEVGVLTDNDVRLYSKTIPNLTSTEETNKAVLGMTLKVIAGGYKRQLQTLAAGGKDVSGFSGLYDNLMGQVDAIETSLGMKSVETTQATGGQSIAPGILDLNKLTEMYQSTYTDAVNKYNYLD